MTPEGEFTKALAGTLTVALGVLFGLLGNSYVTWRRERRAYRAMLRSVASEASSNKVVLVEGFLKFYATGAVLRDFSTAVVTQCVGNPLFVTYSKPRHLEAIYCYLRNVHLANAYREKAERLRMFEDEEEERVADWLEGINDMWGRNLRECGQSIDELATVIGEK